MAATRGKWFESKEHKTAKKFASERQTNLWRVVQAAYKNRAGDKIAKGVRFYAGEEVPKAALKWKGVTVEPIVTK
jgi:hypothetical protein